MLAVVINEGYRFVQTEKYSRYVLHENACRANGTYTCYTRMQKGLDLKPGHWFLVCSSNQILIRNQPKRK
jgi:hypothetical protein